MRPFRRQRFPCVAVYMMADKYRGTIYIGVTTDLPRRVGEHKEGAIKGFTQRYGLKRLVWFERHDLLSVAIQREKSLKRYGRDWKENPIERDNRWWDDLEL